MAHLLGIEIGGTKLQLGRGAGDGRIADLVRLAVDPAKGAEGIRTQILDAFAPWRGQVVAAGIGFGGPVDADRGIVTTSNQIAGWDGFPLVQWARDVLKVPHVVLQNDADTAALGEARFGAGAGLSPILYVNSGSGIGGGLVIDGQIYRGSGVGAIEIGHLWIVDEESMDRDVLTLEKAASGWAIASEGRRIVERARDGREATLMTGLCGADPERVTAQVVAKAAELGDSQANAILQRSVRAMAQGLAHAVTLLSPRRIILGGGVSLIRDDLWLDPIRKALAEKVFPPFRGTYDVVTATLGEEVVIHGALALAADARPTNRPADSRAS